MVAPKAFSASSKNAKWWAHQSSEPPCIITVSTAARAEQRSHRSAAVRGRAGFLSSEAFISATPPRPSGDLFDTRTIACDCVPWSGVTLARDLGDGCRSPRCAGHRVRLCENQPWNSRKRTHTMTLNQSALLELTDVLRTADGGQVMRLMLSAMLQALVDAEATAHIGANPYEHTPTRTTQRNGIREKTVSTTAGDLMVKIPKLRAGSFFPSLLAPRRRIDVALYAVVMEAYVHGVSTRKVDDLVAALGVDAGISKSEVSRICADLDVDVAAFQGRELTEQAFPYVFVDATYCKARVSGRVVSQAVVIVTGVSADGRREVLGSAVGDSETQDFWTEFLRSLRERGLHGVQLVISDHHRGLMNAIGATMVGASWQRCRVHFMRNVLAKVPKGNTEMVAAAIRTIFAQPTGPLVRAQVEIIATMLEPKLPVVADMLR